MFKGIRIIAVIVLVFLFSGLRAQKVLNVNDTTGTQTEISLSSIRKLSFSNENLIVTKINGDSLSFGLNNIQNLTFVKNVVIQTSFSNIKKSNCKLYPNPVIDQLQISFDAVGVEMMRIDIYDFQGKTLYQNHVASQNGTNTIFISTVQLSPGLYICRLQAGSLVESIKFTKTK